MQLPQPTMSGTPMVESQLAASARERSRQMQIRQNALQQQQQQQQQLQLQQQQQQQQHQQNASHMSPPPGPLPSNAVGAAVSGRDMSPTAGGGGAGPSALNVNANATAAAIAQFGPGAAQLIVALQNPMNPYVNHLCQTIPNFMHMPLPQQLQKIQQLQVRSPVFERSSSDVFCLTIGAGAGAG
jgi:hypothetical protein